MNLAPWILGVCLWLVLAGSICLYRRNNGIVDIFWGLGFVVLAVISFLSNPVHSLESWVVTSLVLLWGLRLSIYLYFRNWSKPEDFRYAGWRMDWGKHWVLQSIVKVYLLQALIMQVIAIPIFVSNVLNPLQPGAGTVLESSVVLLGAFIAVTGVLVEAVADRQKSNFKSDVKNSGKICQVGLWSISRHPNYLGEILVWVGIGLVPLGLSSGYLALLSPVFITLLLYFVSGVPLLEKRLEGRPDFEAYKKNTGAIFPRIFR